jgi:signal transduction histidine kinase
MRSETLAAVAGPPPPARGAARHATAAGIGLERFCVALCHDLRGPLATAGAALQRLALLPDGATGGELLSIAHRSLARADELLSALPELLAAERAPSLEPVALDGCVAAARDDVATELELAGGRMAVHGRLPVALAHHERLRVALRNLLRNAIRYRRPDVALEVHLRAEARGRRTVLLVSDNGRGVPPGDRDRMFVPLERGRVAQGAGSGLGLAIARCAVEACGGRLDLVAGAPPGATFAISLRAAGSGDAASRP